METLFLVIVIILFALAISDLVVGVSNDAVNFLNSSIGSRAAPFKTIMVIASIGIILGAVFSNGMMEIARKGIFNPETFYFSEIIFIFLAVMIADVILLDFFNTYGMPTSTTVSIIFELLGASVAISLIKIYNNGTEISELATHINSSKAFAIISGILLSVIIAFTIGAIVQFITRLIFTFKYHQKSSLYSSIWGGIAITAISYFILIKGLKNSSIFAEEQISWVLENVKLILVLFFIGWTILLQILNKVFKIGTLKIVVLVGTFALAMAFAGNDLVNFIGVPLAGFRSYQELMATGAQPSELMMDALRLPVQTPSYFLLIAGIIMVLTLWTSKKARSVTETEINLARQNEGSERFSSTALSRGIVEVFISVNKVLMFILPNKLVQFIDNQFQNTDNNQDIIKSEKPAFDMLRASVNLTVASILIAMATSMQLPLSTTYVTFMVAMGTSLSDRAWGRESAVYRVTGVLAVIGGWFLTAIIAFTIAFIFALIINYGGIYAIFILLILAGFSVFRTHVIHKKKENVKKKVNVAKLDALKKDAFINKCSEEIAPIYKQINSTLSSSLKHLFKEKKSALKKQYKETKQVKKNTSSLKNTVNAIIDKLESDQVESGYFYIKNIDFLDEAASCIRTMVKASFHHVSNRHKPLLQSQINDLTMLDENISIYFEDFLKIIQKKKFESSFEKLIGKQEKISDMISEIRKNHISSIKNKEVSSKNSKLYLSILSQISNLLFITRYILKHYKKYLEEYDL